MKKLDIYIIFSLLTFSNLLSCAKTLLSANQNIQEKIMNQDSAITAENALKELKKAWFDEIKLKLPGELKDVEENIRSRVAERLIIFSESFEKRLNNTEWEKKSNWYRERLITCDENLKKELQKNEQEQLKRGFPRMLYSDYDQFPVNGKCWILEWHNLMQGGFTAYIDLITGKVLAIEIIVEGI